MKVSTFKIDDIWYFQVGKHVEKGFATKDEAQLMGEKNSWLNSAKPKRCAPPRRMMGSVRGRRKKKN